MGEFTAAKREAAIRNARLGNEARTRQVLARPMWACATCGAQAAATAHQMRKTYCSMKCMAEGYRTRLAGDANPNAREGAGRRVCEQCRKEFHHYNKQRRFCSLACSNEGCIQLRTSARKDSNHQAIVDRLERGGALVMDLSRAMFGVPDLLVWHREQYHLVEVKNPKTAYGRKGLNKRQKDWADNWNAPVYIVRSEFEVDAFLQGKLEPSSRGVLQ